MKKLVKLLALYLKLIKKKLIMGEHSLEGIRKSSKLVNFNVPEYIVEIKKIYSIKIKINFKKMYLMKIN